MARRVLIIVVAVIAIILGVIQIMRGLHLISYKPAAKPPQVQVTKEKNQALGERIYLANYGCSLQVPKGWEKKDAAGGGIMFRAPKSSGSSANLIINSEPNAGSLPQYADATIALVKANTPAEEWLTHSFSTTFL